jgi:hydrogenase/urease accessory protein HupE
MLRLSKRVLLATALLTCSTPALAHPGHGVENPLLHRVLHLVSGVDPAWAAMFASVLALALVAGLWVRSRRPNQR